MRKLFAPLVVLAAAMFAYAPIMIAHAPYEVDDGARAEDLLLPRAVVVRDVHGDLRLRHRQRASSCSGKTRRPIASRLRPASSPCCSACMGLVTGPLWGRKAWGVWWQWDARLTMALAVELIFVGYLLVRKYGGPGSDKLAAAMAIFGMVNVPFVYMSVNIWRTVHPNTSVVPTLPAGHARAVLVQRGGLHAVLRAAVHAARSPRAPAGGARRAVSRARGRAV